MQKGIIPHSPSSSSSPLSTSYWDIRGQTFHWFAALSSLGKHQRGDVEWSHELCNRAEPPHLQDAVFVMIIHVLSGVITLCAAFKQHRSSYHGDVWMLLPPIKTLKHLRVSAEPATIIAAQHAPTGGGPRVQRLN